MFNLTSLAKSAALALGLTLGVSGVSSNGTPVLGTSQAAAESGHWNQRVLIRDGDRWQRHGRHWNRGDRGRHWNRGGSHRHWKRGGWNRHGWRHHRRDWRWRDHYRPGLYLNFGIPAYRYVEPRRPAYRVSNAHVNWCYNRYRSYRAWDNTYQPYNGPRRQCWSPYS